MRSPWSRVCPYTNVTGVLMRRQPCEDRAGATPFDYEGRDRRPAATSQEITPC